MQPNTHVVADAIPLWPAGSPELGDAPMPTVQVFPASASVRRSAGLVLVMPGGGYWDLVDHERMPVVAWLNAEGFDAALLLYRVKPHALHPAPLHDAQRAMRLLRSGRFDVESGRPIGAIGFSAGGHLAALLATRHDAEISEQDDLAGSVSARPDAVALCYAVTDFVDPVNRPERFPLPLTEGRDDAAFLRAASPLRHVQPGLPPVFLWHTAADEIVPLSNTLRFAEAARAAGAAVELHVPERGRHGQAMWDHDLARSPLTPALSAFLRRHLGEWTKAVGEDDTGKRD